MRSKRTALTGCTQRAKIIPKRFVWSLTRVIQRPQYDGERSTILRCIEEYGLVATLTIYTMTHCPTCAETHRIAAEIDARYRDLTVRIINLDQTPALRAPAVVSVPTYLLNGTVISLRNPYLEDLEARIRLALAEG